jgi:cytidylate kinase
MAIITISRGTFSGAKALAEAVAQKLDYKYVSREEIIQDIAKYGIPEKKLTSVLKKAPSFWNRYNHTKWRYLKLVRFAILEKAVSHNIVYHGHGGHCLLNEHYWTLRVKLIATKEYRIEQVMIKRNLSRDDAIQYIHDIDESRKKWTEFLYGIDWNDPSCFDMILNIQLLDVESASDAVVTMAQKEPFKPSDISDKIIRQMYLASKVELALLREKKTSLLNINVNCRREGVIELKETPGAKGLQPLIMDVVRNVDGVKEIKNKISYSACH